MFLQRNLGYLRRQAARFFYKLNGCKPWIRGYDACKFRLIKEVLADKGQRDIFADGVALPDNYGYALDERVVEYPWTISRLKDKRTRLLDAGSVFNYEEIVDDSKIKNKDLTIFTLAPETQAFWDRGISYHFGDLRDLPFRDEWFDEVVCLSTLGHVGMDNHIYTKKAETYEANLDAGKAINELLRVLKPGGRLMISVVFGKHQLIYIDGEPYAEQFDSELIGRTLKAFSACQSVSTSFYRYTQKGWNISSEEEASNEEYFNIHVKKTFDADMAAAARAVALIDVVK